MSKSKGIKLTLTPGPIFSPGFGLENLSIDHDREFAAFVCFDCNLRWDIEVRESMDKMCPNCGNKLSLKQ